MAPQYPAVRPAIVAEERLAPIVHDAVGAPERAAGRFQRVGIASQNFGNVVRAVEQFAALGFQMVDEIKNADETANARQTNGVR